MEIEILLDRSQAKAEDYPLIEKRLKDWYERGAEIRYEKPHFGRFSVIEAPDRYLVDLGNTDPIISIRELHAMLYHLGAKIFIHFLP